MQPRWSTRGSRRNYIGGIFWGRGLRGNSWEDYVAHADEDDDLEYWKVWYLSGARKFASDCSNSKLRSTFKDELAHADYEDICSLHHSQYKKYFDYWWTIVWKFSTNCSHYKCKARTAKLILSMWSRWLHVRLVFSRLTREIAQLAERRKKKQTCLDFKIWGFRSLGRTRPLQGWENGS